MPVEINELVIRAVVEPCSPPAGTGKPPADATAQPAAAAARGGGSRGLSQGERESLVQAAVKEVLKVLRRSKER